VQFGRALVPSPTKKLLRVYGVETRCRTLPHVEIRHRGIVQAVSEKKRKAPVTPGYLPRRGLSYGVEIAIIVTR